MACDPTTCTPGCCQYTVIFNFWCDLSGCECDCAEGDWLCRFGCKLRCLHCWGFRTECNYGCDPSP